MNVRLVRSAAIVSSMTLCSRILGFLRDIILALFFGADASFDAFIIAFKIPNFFRRLFGEGAFSQAFIPVLTAYRHQHTDDEVRLFLNRMAGLLVVSLVLVIVIAECCIPVMMMIFAPGFHGHSMQLQYASTMLSITLPYLFFIAFTAFSAAILNTYNRFFIPAITPLLLNIVLILSAYYLRLKMNVPIYSLAWGVLIGGIVQWLAQYPSLRRLRLLPKPQWSWKDRGVRRVLKLMIPALFGVSVVQMGLLIDNCFASFLPAGSISWLYYSDRLIYFPLGVIGVALATVVLPHLSQHHTQRKAESFSLTVSWAIQIVLLIGVPAAIGLSLLAGPLISTLFYYGAFDQHAVRMTARSLSAFAVGLPGLMLVKVLASVFYAQKNVQTPAKIAGIALSVNLILNLALINTLAHVGLALATACASLVNAALLWLMLQHNSSQRFSIGGSWFVCRLLIANSVLAVVIYYVSNRLSDWFVWSLWERSWHLGGLIGLGAISYLVTWVLLGLRPRHLRPSWH